MTLKSVDESGDTVAVVIAAYNAADTVRIAVTSALAQTRVTEVWVIDDASIDATAELALSADDGTGRLRVRRQAKNSGPGAARNIALAQSQADWICVLDADDRFAEGRIDRLLAFGAAELVADSVTRVASLDEPQQTWPNASAATSIIDLASFIEGNVSVPGQYREELGFIKPLMSLGFLRRHGIAYDPDIRLGEDYLLYAQVLAHGGRLRLGPAQGYLALTRSDSLSGRHSIEDLRKLRDCSARLAEIRPLTSAEQTASARHWRSVDDRVQWRRLIEAVKQRDWRGAASTFHDRRASAALLGKLWEQVLVRSKARLGFRA